MRDARIRSLAASVLVVAAFLAGCARPAARSLPPATSVAIASLATVAGKWGGLVTGLPGMRDSDWLDLVIRGDGTYAFASFRTIGAALGEGKLTLRDGKLYTEGERGSGTLTLFDRGGTPQLIAEGVLKPANLPYRAELTRAK